MKRIALYAHYDGQDRVRPYVKFLLSELRTVCEQITFVSTARLTPEELAVAGKWCADAYVKENRGYDFGMWKDALSRVSLADWDEVLLVNSSIFGPLWPLAPIMDRMSARPCDFWGMTSSRELDWHIQSYFLVFKRSVLQSEAFRQFWELVHPYKSKNQVIRSYEVGLSVFLREAGFKPGAVVPVESLRVGWPLPKKSYNPTVKAPMQLLHKGMPFVKGELLRDNPRHQRLGPVLREMARAGYPLELIEFDRPSSTSLRARVSELWASLRARPLGTD